MYNLRMFSLPLFSFQFFSAIASYLLPPASTSRATNTLYCYKAHSTVLPLSLSLMTACTSSFGLLSPTVKFIFLPFHQLFSLAQLALYNIFSPLFKHSRNCA